MPSNGDDEFRPKPGRQSNLGNSSGKRYIKRVLNAAGKINSGFGKSARHSLFTGRNVGRGNHLAASRNSTGQTRFRQRRVVIKARFVKLAGAGFRKAGAHLRC